MATKNAIDCANPTEVACGGTGNASFSVTYAVLCAGTTTTGALQSVASAGTAAQVLTSNGAGFLPTFQTIINNIEPTVTTSATTQDGEIFYNTSSNAFKGRANGVDKTFTVT